MLYFYNARYPDTFDEAHIVFRRYNFKLEFDSSNKRNGLPALCSMMLLPVMPCRINNTVVPIRECSYIGYGKAFEWPRVSYDPLASPFITDASTLDTMLGTAFVSCKSSIHKKLPIIPNIDIKNGYDSVSATGCLKLNFNGTVEPIWLGSKQHENVAVYLERLVGRSTSHTI